MTDTTPSITGLNHVTLAVARLPEAVAFYRDALGLCLRAEWDAGAYLEAGSLWLCLALDPRAEAAQRSDYTHIAFSVHPEDFAALAARIDARAEIWKDNRSEGASLYFLDPDGHRLELHAGTLESRLAHYRAHPRPGMVLCDV